MAAGAKPSSVGSMRYCAVSYGPVPGGDQLVDGRRTGGAQLVQSVVAVDDHGPLGPVGGKHSEHLVGHGRIAHADHLIAGAARVGQGAEVVEHRGDAELLAHRPGEPHGRVEAGREAEPHAHLLDAGDHPGRAEVGHHAEGLEDVGGADGRRRGPPAVFAHLGPGGRHHQCGDGRDVDAAQPVPAGAAGVDDIHPVGQPEGHGVGDHGPDEAGHLLHRLALGPQSGGQPGDLGRRGLTRQHLVEDDLGFVGGERGAGQQGGQDTGPGAERVEGGPVGPDRVRHRLNPTRGRGRARRGR